MPTITRLIPLLASVALLSACTTTVRSYDGQNHLLGTCEVERTPFAFNGGVCYGSANGDPRALPLPGSQR